MNFIRTAAVCMALGALGAAGAAAAEIAVSANDGKQVRDDDNPPGRAPDTVSILEITDAGPKVLGTVRASASLIGPPASVAVTPDETLALVTGAQRLDENGPPVLVLNDTLSVVDIARPSAPRVVQTLRAGAGATGVAINQAGTLALVASTGDDTISVFSIAGRRLTPAGKVSLPYQSRPTDVVFTPDGTGALVVAQGAGRILRLAVTGTKVARTDVAVTPGLQPNGLAMGPRGDFAYNTNNGGRSPPTPAGAGPRQASISAIDLRTNKLAGSVDVGQGLEHLTLSPDGAYMAVVLVNGSSAPPGSPSYNDHGLLKVFRVAGAEMTPVAEARTGHWCQGAVWTKDARRILLQCALEREIQTYRFDGTSLTRDAAATASFAGVRPGGLATAASR